MPFAGLRVLSLESRRAREMEALILRAGGVPFVAPSVAERSVEGSEQATKFLEELEHGRFDMLICMTGTGLAFLRDQIAAARGLERLSAALGKITLVARGPKPVPLLRELGLRPAVVVPEPNTWREIVASVAHRSERNIAVQEYGRSNPELYAALQQLGATVFPIVVYRWALPDDLEPLREAVRRLSARAVDVVLFTSSIQLDHLLQIAAELNLERETADALRHHCAIASVGPVMTASLVDAGFPPDIVPEHPKMAALVKAAAEGAHSALLAKRTAPR
jgi:uroporphyrinogen-III synthase